jgi:uncharacterized membrane protein YeiH
MAAFSLPWYAIIGTQKALALDLPVIACILIGVVGPTAGRYFIDLTSGVTPQHFTKGEWFVGTAVLTSVTYIILDALGLASVSVWPATLLAGWSVFHSAVCRSISSGKSRNRGSRTGCTSTRVKRQPPSETVDNKFERNDKILVYSLIACW